MIKCVNDHIDSLLAQLANLGKLENTTVILLGDNGTESDSIQGPFAVRPTAAIKGNLRRGHSHPLDHCGRLRSAARHPGPKVRGRGYISNPGRREETMVHAVDIFATVAGIVGVASTAEDSVSILPYLGADARLLPVQYYARQFMYTERCSVKDQLYQAAIRNNDYKLIYRLNYDQTCLCRNCMRWRIGRNERSCGTSPGTEALLMGKLNSMWASEGFNPGNGCP